MDLVDLDIMRIVSNKWMEIGVRIGQADYLDNYAKKSFLDNYVSCQQVFKTWIDDGGHPPRYPHTWQGLYDLLCDIEHSSIANKMAEEKNAQGILVQKWKIHDTQDQGKNFGWPNACS